MSIDTSKMDEFAKKLNDLNTDAVMTKAVNRLTGEVLRQTIRQTPRDTSNLARNWKATQPTKSGNTYKAEVYNNTDYGVYVEYGHRTRNHKGWVPGQFMMTNAVINVDEHKDRLLSPILKELLNDK